MALTCLGVHFAVTGHFPIFAEIKILKNEVA